MEYRKDLGTPLWKLRKFGLESAELCGDVVLMLLPIWVSVVVGLLVGWSWKPRWVGLLAVALRSRPRLAWSFPPGFGPRRMWLAASAAATAPAVREVWGRFLSWIKDTSVKFNDKTHSISDAVGVSSSNDVTEPSREALEGSTSVVDDRDLNELYKLLDDKDGGPSWILLMDKVTKGMTYKAWRRDVNGSPTEYRSQTVVESCAPELMRDFFWDDDFRPEWDDMLTFAKTLQECELTGYQVVQWIRKFPFFCKDREYVIGRRIFSRGNTYYCVTKGVDHPSAPPRPSPRRVSVFFSSWRIKPLENGAVEVLLFHREDMGIQRDVAKLGVRQGMWGAVRKIEPGVRAYQQARLSKSRPMSRCASMANLHTPVSISRSGGNLPRAWKSVVDLHLGLASESTPGRSTQRSVSFNQRSIPTNPSELQAVAENPLNAVLSHGTPPAQNAEALSTVDAKPSGNSGRGRPAAPHHGLKKFGVVVFGTCLAASFGVDKAIICKVMLAGLVQRLVARHTATSLQQSPPSTAT